METVEAPLRRDHLERAVLEALWARPEGCPASEVLVSLGERDGRPLATTTVLTVLERLRRKGLVRRRRVGRSYHHSATSTREELVVTAMLAALDDGDDRPAALARFVGAAGAEDLRVMREVLVRAQEAACGARATTAGPGAGPSRITGCGGSGGSCGCCTCGPGCACCQAVAA